MARPEWTEVEAGSQAWDADLNAIFALIFDGPFPVDLTADETALLALDPTDYEDCLEAVTSTHDLWKSDGTEWRRYGKGQINAHGARANRVVKEATSGALAGATYDFTDFFPAGSTNRSFSLRVTTLITGATSFDVGTAADPDMLAAAVALAAGTTKTMADRTASPESAAALTVRLTANGSNFTAGEVRLVGAYDELSAPTS